MVMLICSSLIFFLQSVMYTKTCRMLLLKRRTKHAKYIHPAREYQKRKVLPSGKILAAKLLSFQTLFLERLETFRRAC